MEGDRRAREDPRGGPTRLIEGPEPGPVRDEAAPEVGRKRGSRPWRDVLARARGPWRVAVVEGSMLPAIAPGDWLLVDPTVRRWPQRGSVVVFEPPDSAGLSIKRVAAGPNDVIQFGGGYLRLGHDEAWLLSDADEAAAAAAGFGAPRDSRQFGPVPLELLIGRAWFRYAPLRRIGRIGRARGIAATSDK